MLRSLVCLGSADQSRWCQSQRHSPRCVSICAFVPVKQVKLSTKGVKCGVKAVRRSVYLLYCGVRRSVYLLYSKASKTEYQNCERCEKWCQSQSHSPRCVSICAFVPVKQVKLSVPEL